MQFVRLLNYAGNFLLSRKEESMDTVLGGYSSMMAWWKEVLLPAPIVGVQ